MQLVWQEIKSLRDAGFFGNELAGIKALGVPNPDSPVTEANLIRAFNKTGLRGELMSNSAYPPGWVGSNTPLFFDVIEYLYHETTAEDNREAVRERLNPDLARYTPPMELLSNGQIVERAPDGLRPLLEDPIPDHVPAPLGDPLESAIQQYRRRGATAQEKKAAITQLAGVLEPLRHDIDETFMPKDESDLFHIANKFALRHNKAGQKRNYDEEIWLDWIFQVYLSTARALLAVMDRQELQERVDPEPDDSGGIPF